ncbi:hypothetical protein GMSM_08570 [Geomonas sp. Red276]
MRKGIEKEWEGFGKMTGTDMTPGRAPAEGPDMDIATPTHERWEQGTPFRGPAEGDDFGPEKERKQK